MPRKGRSKSESGIYLADVASYKWSSYLEYLGEEIIIDKDFALDVFSNDRKKALESFKAFHQLSNDDQCLDVGGKRRLTDNDAIEIIKSMCQVNHCDEIQVMGNDQFC